MNFVLIIAMIVVTVVLRNIYHKVFDIIYIGFGALIKEWVICFILSGIIVGAVLKLFGISS